jgi:uncharacterized protein (DUF952 family)
LCIGYHGTPKAYYEGLDPNQPYISPTFDRDGGMIHCTDGREAVSVILTIGYRHQPEVEFVVLYIDTDKVQAPVKIEDPAGIYPHIYGPLNRDAIVGVRDVLRPPDGIFHMPPAL